MDFGSETGAAKMDLICICICIWTPLASLGEHGGRCPQGAEAWVGVRGFLREDLASRPKASCWICLPLSLSAERAGLVNNMDFTLAWIWYCGLCSAWVVYLAKVR